MSRSIGEKQAAPSTGVRQSFPTQRAMHTDSKHNSLKRHPRCSPANMQMCSERNGWEEHQNGTHPNPSSQSSLSMAVTLASSIARITNTEAWEARNHCGVACEKAREHAWRQTRMDECSGTSGTYTACAAPGLGAGYFTGQAAYPGRDIPNTPSRTHSWPSTTRCGQALTLNLCM